MYGDAASLLLVLLLSDAHLIKASIVLSSAAFWTLVGMSMVLAGSRWGYFSAAGSWSICGASILLLSVAQLGRQL
jgi:hypothetical protein